VTVQRSNRSGPSTGRVWPKKFGLRSPIEPATLKLDRYLGVHCDALVRSIAGSR